MGLILVIPRSGLKTILGLIILALTYSTFGCGGSGGGDGAKKFAWDAPTTNVDGSELTDLAGYILYYGISPSVLNQEIDVGNETTYPIPLLPQGTYYFAVKAYDRDNNLSDFSNVLCVNFPQGTQCP